MLHVPYEGHLSCSAGFLKCSSWLTQGGVSSIRLGRRGLVPIDSWYGENPFTLESEFFAFIHHANAISLFFSRFLSSVRSFSIISPRIPLCRSMVPLLHGEYAAVVITLIPNFSAMLMKLELANSPPLSTTIFPTDPQHLDPYLKNTVDYGLRLFIGDKFCCYNLVHISMRWITHDPLMSFRSIATVSKKELDIGSPTMGLGGDFFYPIHTSQLLLILLISSNNSSF